MVSIYIEWRSSICSFVSNLYKIPAVGRLNPSLHTGSCMSAHVLLNFLNELRKKKKKRKCDACVASILSLFRSEFGLFFIIMSLTLHNRGFLGWGGGGGGGVGKRSHYIML